MKNLLFAFLLLSLGASAQTTNQAKSLCLSPACPISFVYGVTDTVFVEINASDGNGISYWRQLSGPTITLPKDTAIWVTSIEAFDGFYLSGLPAGYYVLQDSVVTKSGSMAKATVTFTVLPPAPSCPTIPLAGSRVLSWTVIIVNGTGRIQVTYWDGNTALLP